MPMGFLVHSYNKIVHSARDTVLSSNARMYHYFTVFPREHYEIQGLSLEHSAFSLMWFGSSWVILPFQIGVQETELTFLKNTKWLGVVMDPKVCIPILKAFSPKAGLLLGLTDARCGFLSPRGRPLLPTPHCRPRRAGSRVPEAADRDRVTRGLRSQREPSKRFPMDSSAPSEQSFLGSDLVF